MERLSKADLKGAIGIDTSSLEAKPDLVNLKGQVGKTDINKLKMFLLTSLCQVTQQIIMPLKTVYDKLVAKFNTTDTSGFVLKNAI